VQDHIAHTRPLLEAIDRAGIRPRRALDLGSGGGVPGLLMAEWLPTDWTLLEAQDRRCAFLRAAIDRLGVGPRVEVAHGRAEVVAYQPDHRGGYDLVTARSFGPPAVTAECGIGFLAVGGVLAVSEPPEPEPGRWPPEALDEVGLAIIESGPWMLARLTRPVPESLPRRDGVPRKRPRW
jgi:16S rRNA (guanine527-N7)-methyltransferase